MTCAISFLQRAVTLAIFMFRFNVMGFLLFVFVNMSVILYVYAFLGQRSKAVSCKGTLLLLTLIVLFSWLFQLLNC